MAEIDAYVTSSAFTNILLLFAVALLVSILQELRTLRKGSKTEKASP